MEYDDLLSAEEIQTVQIYHLPNEILSKIFDHLDLPEKLRSDEAFKGYKNVQSCLWRIVKLEVEEIGVGDRLDYLDRPLPFTDLLKILQKSGQYLRTLGFDLNGCGGKNFKVIYNDVGKRLYDWAPERFLQCAIDHCNNLRSLKLHLVSRVEIEFCKLIKVNEKLENILLHISNMNQLEYQQLSKALESFPKLNKSLSLDRDQPLGANDYVEVEMCGTFNLEKLNLQLLFCGYRGYMQKLELHNLKILHLGPFIFGHILWAGIDMKTIAEFKNLTELKIISIHSFDANVDMPVILKGCTKLEKFALSSQENVSAECMNTIMTSSASLKTVELVRVGMHSLLLDGAKSKIESLLIKDCTFNSKREIRKVKYFPYLKKLNLTAEECSFDRIEICNLQVSDADLSAISENCWKLEEVILNVQSTQLTNGIASFVDLPKLRSCEFSSLNCTAIYPEKTIPSLVELQSACGDGNGLARHFCGSKLPISNLRSLKLYYCNKLPESSLIQAVSHMPYLETFNIDDRRCKFTSSMTDEVITNLVTFCRKLRILHLKGCRAVTASGIIALKDCLSLVTLRLVELEIQPFLLSDLVKPNLKSLQLTRLQNVPIGFVINNITKEMRKSMFTLMYDGERII